MLEQAFDFMASVNKEFKKQEFVSDSRNTIYEPLFYNSFQHCVAVLLLIKENLHSSSEALLRPVLETYLRAMWVKYCVDNTTLNKLANNKKDFPNLSNLLKVAETDIPTYKGTDFFSKQIKPLVNNLHDFTHGGMQSIAKQYVGNSLSNQRGYEDKKEKINFVTLITYLILCETSKADYIDLNHYYEQLKKLQLL